jgi:uracil phosphoribosyltransferase
VRTEELQQPLEDRQAKATAKRNPEVENVRRMVEAAILNADQETMMKWKAEADLKTKAEEANCKAEAAEREAEAARVVVLEAATGLEKAAANEVRRATCSAAKAARDEARKAARKAAKSWCT